MRCCWCDTPNPAEAKFCQECGTPFMACCSNCGTELPRNAKFCPECGHPVADDSGQAERRSPHSYTPKHLADKILTSRGALEGERKQVTVLFADVKGSLAWSERVDPEEWHRIMDRFFAILSEGIHRFEGTINQFTGDGVMALFGAPIAHEDHAQRACYAALELRDELRRYSADLKRSQGLALPVRIGVNSGEVVVGRIGDDLRMDYTAQGHTVGIAARLEQLADPGTVYLSASTTGLAGGYFEFRDLGLFEVKGAREPLQVYELLAAGAMRTRLEISRARGFSRFVGRTQELAALEAALERAAQGEGGAIGLVGDAGIGKSRLCYEFLERCRAQGNPVHSVHAVPYGSAVPFLPVLSLFRSYFGISDFDSPQESRRKIAGTLLLVDETLTDTLPVMFDFLGVSDPARPAPDLDPEAKQRALFEVLKKIASSEGASPGVTLLEDLHWLDAGSEAFLAQLGDVLGRSRELLLLNYRPGYDGSWLRKLPYQELRLAPLGEAAIGELLQDLLGPKLSSGELADRIRERASGYPFFVEEVIRSLAEAGCLQGEKGAYELTRPIGELTIPPSVQAILAARIDRLGEREKEVLQTSSVIGKEFAEDLLRKVVDLPDPELAAVLARLERGEFLSVERTHPARRYAFHHPLTQEVAYRSQLADRRTVIHGRVARAVEDACCQEKLDESAALLAHHWEQAGDALNAARWSLRAGKWAAPSDLTQALSQYRKSLSLLDSIPDTPETRGLKMTAQAGIVQVAAFAPVAQDELSRTFEEGKALAQRSRDPRALAVLLTAYGTAQASGGDADSALEHAKEAIRLAKETGDPEFELQLRSTIMFAYFAAGRLREGIGYVAESNQRLFGKEHASVDPTNFVGSAFRAMMLTYMGRLEEAAHDLETAIRLAQEQGSSFSWMRGSMVDIAYFAGRPEWALNHGRAGVEAAERYGSPFFTAVAYRALGIAHVVRQEWQEANTALSRALDLIRSSRTARYMEGSILAMQVRPLLGLGEGELARQTAEEALGAARKSHARLGECQARLALARVLREAEGAEATTTIESQLRALQEGIETTGARSFEPFGHLERAELARLLADDAMRRHELQAAHDLFRAFGATGHAERLAAELRKT